MRTRDSGMPEEPVWAGFFDPEAILLRLGLDAGAGDVVDFGCGYGTFTVPAARIISGVVHALDIDPDMLARTAARAREAGLENVRVDRRDYAAGTGLPEASVGYVMLFNNLHDERPMVLLDEVRRVLVPGGRLAIIHWNYDPSTPRGPAMDIRVRPEQCCAWAEQVGFAIEPPGVIDLPPHHFGLTARRLPPDKKGDILVFR